MLVISGNITLMARAAQMVLTCNPSSGATPADYANWKSRAAKGALSTNNSASAGVATDGALAGTDSRVVGATAAFSTQHGGLCRRTAIYCRVHRGMAIFVIFGLSTAAE
jgi:hypothetical protein